MKHRQQISQAKRWVIKVGSSLLTSQAQGLDQAAMAAWARQIAALVKGGVQVVLVSSGAVAEGMMRMGWDKRPHELHKLQAAAAIGQMGLVQAYESCFKHHGIHTAQVLLTHDDLSNRQRYLNARSALKTLLQLAVIPVVNENDTVVTEEIRFGDNDTLAALVANLIEADLLLILTDQDGLYSDDPRRVENCELISQMPVNDPRLDAMVSDKAGTFGKGGMLTKLRAARLAARSGTATVIARGSEAQIISQIARGVPIGTFLIPDKEPLLAKKQWLAGHLRLNGAVVIDDGAVRVLQQQGRSLLPVGVVAVQGVFQRGEVIACQDRQGHEIARGLSNYSADETHRIMGQSSGKIEQALGYVDEPELIHRDNMVIAD